MDYQVLKGAIFDIDYQNNAHIHKQIDSKHQKQKRITKLILIIKREFIVQLFFRLIIIYIIIAH